MTGKHFLTRSATIIMAAILMGGAGAVYANASPKPQAVQSAASKNSAAKAAPAAVSNDVQVEPGSMDATREKLNQMLEQYPRLTSVVSRDPSLLANQEYVTGNAPGLWEFLQKHPEIAADPEFFLGYRLKRAGFEGQDGDPVLMRILNDLWPFMVFVIMVGTVLWILRVVLENRRWSRLAKVQADVHTKLLEKFGSSQELLSYMETEAGRRFLESAPIPIDLEQRPRISAPLGRILWSAQLGLILGLAGAGMLYIRGQVPDAVQPLLVFGTLGLTFGIGFVLSAAVSYVLSKHLGLFEHAETASASRAELGPARGQ
jgi:hypothetical protein